MANVEIFRSHILEAGVLDPEGVHHGLVSDMHGQKLDFDLIPTNSPLYSEWVSVAVAYISSGFSKLPEIIVGVANGTNRLALDVARQFDGQVFGAVSEKDRQNSKILRLGLVTGKLISAMRPEFVVVLEDVGTTGSNSVQVAQLCLEAGARSIEVVNTWQRRPQLERLIESGIPYQSIINEVLETYTPQDCQDHGFCADNWQFISR